jgi:hypothetical protein
MKLYRNVASVSVVNQCISEFQKVVQRAELIGPKNLGFLLRAPSVELGA